MNLTSVSPGNRPSPQRAEATKAELVKALAEKRAFERIRSRRTLSCRSYLISTAQIGWLPLPRSATAAIVLH